MMPWPKFAGNMYTKYFHCESSNCNDVTSAFPRSMRTAPRRTSQMSFPHRDMTIPATRPLEESPKTGLPDERLLWWRSLRGRPGRVGEA